MAVRIAGERIGLWHAVDDEGEPLGVLIQRGRGTAAARKPTRKLLGKQGFAPAVATTGEPRSCRATFSDPGPTARRGQGLRRNNRAGVSHQPIRRRERRMRRFQSPGSAQRFVAMHSAVCDAFDIRRRPISRRTPLVSRTEAVAQWRAAVAA